MVCSRSIRFYWRFFTAIMLKGRGRPFVTHPCIDRRDFTSLSSKPENAFCHRRRRCAVHGSWTIEHHMQSGRFKTYMAASSFFGDGFGYNTIRQRTRVVSAIRRNATNCGIESGPSCSLSFPFNGATFELNHSSRSRQRPPSFKRSNTYPPASSAPASRIQRGIPHGRTNLAAPPHHILTCTRRPAGFAAAQASA
jgi:hypothetical protein